MKQKTKRRIAAGKLDEHVDDRRTSNSRRASRNARHWATWKETGRFSVRKRTDKKT